MFSFPYFRQIVKSNTKFLAAFTFVLCLFLIVMTNVFTPETVSGLQSATKGTLAAHILTGNGTLIGLHGQFFLCPDGHHLPHGLFHHGGKSE